MTEKEDKTLTQRRFYKAEQEASFAEQQAGTIQTEHPAYRLAFRDTDFLLRDELRPVRFQLELLKTEMLLEEANIGSTLVFYGSARIPSPEAAEALVAAAASEEDRRVAERLAANAKYYEEARRLAQLASQCALVEKGMRQFVVCSGGGPSIMEAANRGAQEVGAETLALNIVLPHEQAPNPYVTPDLSFNFHYFAIRKMHFLMRARAIVVFPGGFGTLDEMFEAVTLIQTGRMKRVPIVLFGGDYWRQVVNFDALVEAGVVARADLGLLTFVETVDEALAAIGAEA